MTPKADAPKAGPSGPDRRLLLPLLEKKILRGEAPDKIRRVLADRKTWKALDPDGQRRWAQLAQMAGDPETALSVLDHLNRTCPDRVDAWEDRAELLSILGRTGELAAAAAQFKHRHGRPLAAASTVSTSSTPSTETADDMAAAAPFSALRRREAAVDRYLSLFSGREDVFARQWADKAQGKQGYVPVRRAITPADVADHLKGGKTYGIYLLRADATVTTAVIDADLRKEFRETPLSPEARKTVRGDARFLLSRIKEIAGDQGVPVLVEVSGNKGYHFWFFFAEPVPAQFAMALLSGIRNGVAGDLSAFGLEVFPKQTALTGKGLGNLVKLPLGIHRLSGKPSYFPDCGDRAVEAQLSFLRTVKRIDPAAVRPVAGEGRVIPHPVQRSGKKPSGAGKTDSEKGPPADPALAALTSACPPLASVIAACREGQTPTPDEEKVLLGTVGFMENGAARVHALLSRLPDYNAHLVDYKLSRVRGTVLGCRRIHRLLDYDGPECRFPPAEGYPHPLRHLGGGVGPPKAERDDDLAAALDRLKLAIFGVERFLKPS